jgi:hypothetical protein
VRCPDLDGVERWRLGSHGLLTHWPKNSSIDLLADFPMQMRLIKQIAHHNIKNGCMRKSGVGGMVHVHCRDMRVIKVIVV